MMNNQERAHKLPRRVKRSHKKSRLGCIACKRRRIKCDESRPACEACERRALDCVYGTQADQTPPRPDTEECGLIGCYARLSPPPSSTEPSPSSTTSPNCLGLAESDLLQHYLHHTTKTFDGVSAHSQIFWQTAVPALGYTSSAVRLGLLTTAALCLYNDTKASDREKSLNYLRAAEYYGEHFVEISSQQLRRLETDDADVHLTCSRLLTVLAFAFFRVYQQQNGATILDHEAWTWLHMLRGSAVIHQRYKNNMGKLTDVLANELVAEVSQVDVIDTYMQQPHFQYIKETRHERFAALYDAIHAQSLAFGNDQAAEVVSAIRALEDVTEELCSGQTISLLHSLCRWPCMVSKGFVDILEGGDLLALVIQANWLMLMVLAEDAWFIGDMGQAGIIEINELCGAKSSANVERSLLGWSLQML